MHDLDRDTSEWDQLWGFGRENALRSGVAANDHLEKFWITAVPSQNVVPNVLDIACGNGVLARYIDQSEFIQRSGGEYTGVDSAQIKPPNSSSFKFLKPTFCSNRNIEDVQFNSDQFNVVISQFGFEYCEKETTIALIARWLRADGHVVFVAHSETSAITLESKQILEQLRILEESALIPLLYRLFERLEAMYLSNEARDERADFLRQRVNATCSNLKEIAGYLHESRFLIATMGLLLSLLAPERAHIPPSIRKENLYKLSTNLQHQQTRLKQQFECALSEKDIAFMKTMWADHKFADICFETLVRDDEELGVVLRARKLA